MVTTKEQEEAKQRAIREFSGALANLLEAFASLPPLHLPQEPNAPSAKAACDPNGPIEVWPYMDTKTLAELLGVGAQTIRKWRLTGGGPPYLRIGGAQAGRVLYKREDVEAWLVQRRFPHTSAETAHRWELEREHARKKRR
jgi:hypothetical protein